MYYIPILLGSSRLGRQSPKVAKYLLRELSERPDVNTELLDLKVCNFSILDQPLRYNKNPPESLVLLSEKIKQAHAVVVVSPEYNNGYPAVLKNALDYLYPEFYHKPIAIATISGGGFGGINALAQLRLVFLKMKAIPTAEIFPVSFIQTSFDEEGYPADKDLMGHNAQVFINDLLWYAEVTSTQPISKYLLK